MNEVSKAATPYSPEEAGYLPERLSVLDAFYQRLIDEKKTQCAAFAMSRSGKIFAEHAMGKQHYDEADPRPCRYDAIRRIASITKLFTAVAVMKLVEDGWLEAIQPVASILREFDNDLYRGVTIAHLLSHTSGICPDGGTFFEPYSVSWWDLCTAKDARYNWIEAVLSMPRRNAPGVEWAYSSTGYTLLGEIISRVTKTPAEAWIETNLTQPLGMTDTAFDIPKEKWDRIIATETWSDPYQREKMDAEQKLTLEREGRKEINTPRTGGGLYSTVHDLLIFGEMLLNKGTHHGVRILSRKTVEMMTADFTHGVPNFTWGTGGTPKHYGLGPDLYGLNRPGLNSPGTFGHEGAGRSSLYIDPVENFVTVSFVPTTLDWEPETINHAANVMWSGLI